MSKAKRKSPVRKRASKPKRGLDFIVAPPEPIATFGKIVGVAEEPLKDAPKTYRKLHTVAWPADWAQAVKQRFAPAWALKRWPVLLEHASWFEDHPLETPPEVSTGFTATVKVEAGDVAYLGGNVIGHVVGQAPTPTERQRGWDSFRNGIYAPPSYDADPIAYDEYFEGELAACLGNPRPAS